MTVQSERRAWETIDVPETQRKATIQHSPVVNKQERFESLFQDSERRKKSVEQKQKKKDYEINEMHKKTNQVLKLSRVFKTTNDKDPKRNRSPDKSIQSEVRSDQEIK